MTTRRGLAREMDMSDMSIQMPLDFEGASTEYLLGKDDDDFLAAVDMTLTTPAIALRHAPLTMRELTPRSIKRSHPYMRSPVKAPALHTPKTLRSRKENVAMNDGLSRKSSPVMSPSKRTPARLLAESLNPGTPIDKRFASLKNDVSTLLMDIEMDGDIIAMDVTGANARLSFGTPVHRHTEMVRRWIFANIILLMNYPAPRNEL